MTPSSMIAIRYTGDSRRSEAPITGKGKEWWPGELRCVPLARGSQLLAAGLGWERDEDEDDLVAVTAAQTSAGAVGVAGVTASGGMVGPDGSPVSGGGAAGTVTAAQIISGTLGGYTADTTYVTADTSGGVEKGTLVRWDTSMSAWVFDFYRSAKVL